MLVKGATGDQALTHWGRDKTAANLQTTISNALPWMKMYEFRLKFHWNLFLMVQYGPINNIPSLVQIMPWYTGQATSHQLNQRWLVYRRMYASLDLNELIFLENWVDKLSAEGSPPCVAKACYSNSIIYRKWSCLDDLIWSCFNILEELPKLVFVASHFCEFRLYYPRHGLDLCYNLKMSPHHRCGAVC